MICLSKTLLTFVAAIAVCSNAWGGLITSVAFNPAGNVGVGNGINGNTVTSGTSFWADVSVRWDGTGNNIVDVFSLRLDITNVSGTDGRLTFAPIASQLAQGANDFQNAASNYIFGDPTVPVSGRNTNALFYTSISGDGKSIQIADGADTTTGLGNNPPPGQRKTLVANQNVLVARVLVQSNLAMSVSDQYNVRVAVASGAITNSLIASNQVPNSAANVLNGFTFDRFGFYGPQPNTNNGVSYGTLGLATDGIINNTSININGSISAVPEPSSFALLGVASIAAVGYRWRRKRKSN